MKGILGLVGLLLSLAIVGFLVKQQMSSTRQILPTLQLPASEGAQPSASAPTATRAEQSQQVQQQLKQAVEGALQQPRSVPEEK